MGALKEAIEVKNLKPAKNINVQDGDAGLVRMIMKEIWGKAKRLPPVKMIFIELVGKDGGSAWELNQE